MSNQPRELPGEFPYTRGIAGVPGGGAVDFTDRAKNTARTTSAVSTYANFTITAGSTISILLDASLTVVCQE
jgi:hypothetical protein